MNRSEAAVLIAFMLIMGLGIYGILKMTEDKLSPQPEIGGLARYPDGRWFVPAGSGLGEPLSQVKMFEFFDGTRCLTIDKQGRVAARASMADLGGLVCWSKQKWHDFDYWCDSSGHCGRFTSGPDSVDAPKGCLSGDAPLRPCQ
jgi:hypothetical protein